MKAEHLKYLSLVVMIVQTTCLVLTLRYSRTMKTEGPRYISSTAVVSSEVVKVFTALVVLFHQNGYSCSRFSNQLNSEIIQQPADCFKVSIPAIAYVLQNNLLFIALSKLDAATYQVTYQLKILTTALLSVVMLSRSLNATKWTSLILLMIGVALVQMPTDATAATAAPEHSVSDRLLGLIAVVAACFTSAFSGVYMEKILKQSPVSMWVRNLQLGVFSVVTGSLGVLMYDWTAVAQDGFFQGYNLLIWAVVFQQAYSGLVISYVIKYADNILKGFAASMSIVLSSVISYLVLGDLVLSGLFVLGAGLVIGSVFIYNYDPKPAPRVEA